jgi:serine/threonine protein kinase/tetratricopeptide (TPR) repeat protein
VNTPDADPMVGKLVSQYEILAKLGGGGMGIVYAAKDTKLGRRVALKFLPPQWSHDDSAKQRFIREAQAASSTDHRNICTIHNIESTDDGQLFIVMAHYEGQTLKQRLEGGALEVDEAVDIAAQIAEGLAKAHAQGVVHRDIKPGNLMITEDAVKILDFGLAKFADALQLTIPGSTLGTVAYMAPEQARGEEADARSDVWALGVVLYQMLTGDVPFKGAYAEAILYAIRNDPPPPLNAAGRSIPEGVERIVLRALEKDPARRFQTARELARELRLLQGRTISVELRTPVPPLPRIQRLTHLRVWQRRGLAGAVVLLGAVAFASVWIAWPVKRLPVAVAPVANQTGNPELDDYRLALTHALTTELMDSGTIRVLPYSRLLQILQRFLLSGTDVSSREALQALTTHSAAGVVIVPSLIYENSAWRARAEIRNSETATNSAAYETDPVVSSLTKDTAYALMTSLAQKIQEHFSTQGSLRVHTRDAFRSFATGSTQPAMRRFRTLDAAKAFADGIGWFEELEYAAAERSFISATKQDARNSLALAWLSRVSQILRQSDASGQAADQASRLVSEQMPEIDTLFIAAVSAEAQRDFTGAEERYRELVEQYSDEPAWLMELASYQDRLGRTADAIASYRQVLALDGRLPRARLELCRLYNRLNESASANEEGQRAAVAYRALGNRGGEAQALMCLTDMLRLGDDKQRVEARQNAETALKILRDLGYGYNLSRAHYYVALAAEGLGRPAEAVEAYERSLSSAREAGNVILEPLVLMNLGAMHGILANQAAALDYLQQSRDLYEKFGDEQRAAQSEANMGTILIEYSDRHDEGLRDIQNALGVFRKLGDKNFEMFAAKGTALHHRYGGRLSEAERELNRALALAKGWDMDREVPTLTVDLARVRFEMADYGAARSLLVQAVGDGSGKDSAKARIHLGLVHLRLGQSGLAKADFDQALRDVRKSGHAGHLALLHTAMGELAIQSDHWSEARTHFGNAVALWTDNLPEPASVEARAYLGLLDALEGKPARGQMAVQSSLDHAIKVGPLSLEARCRIYLARIQVGERRFQDALTTLNVLAAYGKSMLGSDVQAQVHYWRSRALEGRGDRAGAHSEQALARKLIQDMRASLPEQYRDGFGSRPDIRPLIE